MVVVLGCFVVVLVFISVAFFKLRVFLRID